MKKTVSLLLVLMLAALLLASCGSVTESDYRATAKGEYYALDSSNGLAKIIGETEAEPALDADESVSRKIIKTYRLSLETLEYEKAVSAILSEAEALGGYVSSSSEYGNSYDEDGTRSASFTVRIPAAQSDEYLKFLEKECNAISSTLSTEEITDSYYNTKSQLESLQKEEEYLMGLMEKADTLEYMLKIEDKLTSVRSEISELNYQLQLMDKSVDYSYFYLNLSEVEIYQPKEELSYLQKLGKAFTGAFRVFWSFLKAILLAITWSLPFLLAGGVIAVLIVVLVKKSRRKKSRGAKPSEKQ